MSTSIRNIKDCGGSERLIRAKKGICQAFPAYSGCRTVPGVDSNIIPKWKDLIDNALDELIMVPPLEVRSPD